MNEFPWAALLILRSTETDQTSRCGGSLISSQHVLTAAHCLREFSNRGEVNVVWDDISVVLGEIGISISNGNIFLNISQENTTLRMALRRLLSNPRQRGYPTPGSTIDCLLVR